MQRGPIGPLCISAAKIFRRLRRGDFPGVGIDERLRGWLRLFSVPGSGLLEPVALAVHLENVDVMGEAIEQRAGETLIAENARPFVERQIGRDNRRSAFVALTGPNSTNKML